MKSNTVLVVLALAMLTSGCVASKTHTIAPGVTSWHEVVQSPVLKVYTAREREHRFVAYVVNWKGSEVVVSDPLAQGNCKVGDTISFLAQKITFEKHDSETIKDDSETLNVLCFTWLNQEVDRSVQPSTGGNRR
jgi:hypothetical protein